MFEFLFKYSRATFDRGEFVLASGWPLWAFVVLALVAAAVCVVSVSRFRRGLGLYQSVALATVQTLVAIVVLGMLWRPALLTQVLRPQDNTVAVLLDRSASMAYADDADSRIDVAREVLAEDVLPQLDAALDVRTYAFASTALEVAPEAAITADGQVTDLGGSVLEILRGAAAGGLAAVIVMSDGSDNAQSLDAASMAEIAGFGVPVHTIGVGREVVDEDIELEDVILAANGPAGSTASAQVSIRHAAGGFAQLKVYDGDAILATESIQLPDRPGVTTRAIDLDVGDVGVRDLRFSLDAMPGERNVTNNTQLRPMEVPDQRSSVLYIEGEPRWEYKFMRRAVGEDSPLRLASMLRTTPNKFYRQGIARPDELENGFPTDEATLFQYDGLIIGSYEAAALTPEQHTMISEFVSRRGGSLLMLGGRRGLADGGWGATPIADLLPVALPELDAPSFIRYPARVVPTEQGLRSLITRFDSDDDLNAAAWAALPEIADYQYLGAVKPAANVLLEAEIQDGREPLLVHQRFGLGNVYVLATGGTWRWQMQMPHEDMHHETFWKQLLQALASSSARRLSLSSSRPFYADDEQISLRAELRDAAYAPSEQATLDVSVSHPSGIAETVTLQRVPGQPGTYEGVYAAPLPGIYRFAAEATAAETAAAPGDALVAARLAVRREDGVAEYFRVQQNRGQLERLAAATGGRYFAASNVDGLGEAVSFSQAGIVERQLLELWNMPILFLLLILLKGGEWLLRLRWGRL